MSWTHVLGLRPPRLESLGYECGPTFNPSVRDSTIIDQIKSKLRLFLCKALCTIRYKFWTWTHGLWSSHSECGTYNETIPPLKTMLLDLAPICVSVWYTHCDHSLRALKLWNLTCISHLPASKVRWLAYSNHGSSINVYGSLLILFLTSTWYFNGMSTMIDLGDTAQGA